MIGLKVIGAGATAAVFARAAVAIPVATIAAVHHWGVTLQTLVKVHASGRPGPNVVTGAYRDSIDLDFRVDGLGAMATVFSDHPASHRLELGFVGADSLGRVYNQPPFPHFAPAAALAEEGLVETVMKEVRAI